MHSQSTAPVLNALQAPVQNNYIYIYNIFFYKKVLFLFLFFYKRLPMLLKGLFNKTSHEFAGILHEYIQRLVVPVLVRMKKKNNDIGRYLSFQNGQSLQSFMFFTIKKLVALKKDFRGLWSQREGRKLG